jgi:2-succinyl-6-hydroxy-2,4-cyclohexadiene-1-carboxylate synthase
MTEPVLVFLHGFTQTHHHWHGPARSVATALAGNHTLRFIDLPGHGLSTAERISISSSAPALARLGGRGTWIGYSMGARFALHAALTSGHQIEQLVLIGATAGIERDDERAERRALDEQRAILLETRGVDAFLDEWLSMPMFARLPADESGRAHRRRNSSAGLASSLRLAGTGSQASLWHRLDEITIPVLLLAGEHDHTFVGIGRRMADALPNARFTAVADAAHAAHTERPDAVAEAIRAWVRA